MPVMGEICQHGQLRRVCHTCELLSDLTASRAENARLREAIERAPHLSSCEWNFRACNCWKRDALGGDL